MPIPTVTRPLRIASRYSLAVRALSVARSRSIRTLLRRRKFYSHITSPRWMFNTTSRYTSSKCYWRQPRKGSGRLRLQNVRKHPTHGWDRNIRLTFHCSIYYFSNTSSAGEVFPGAANRILSMPQLSLGSSNILSTA